MSALSFPTSLRLLACLLLIAAPGCASDALHGPAPSEHEVIAFMESADSAQIFTVDPDGKRGPPNELDRIARKAFVAFISNPDNFGRPLGMPIAPPEVGIEFQKGAKKLAIYTTWQFGCFYDRYPPEPGGNEGFSFLAVLGEKQGKLADEWRQKYFPRPSGSP